MIKRMAQSWRAWGGGEFVLLSGAVVLCALAWVFVSLAGQVSAGDLLELEESIMLAMRDAADPSRPRGAWWWQEVGRDVTALGGATVLILGTLLVLGHLLLIRRFLTAAFVAVAVFGGYALSASLKNVYDRERPAVVPHFDHVVSASFPSGHAMSSAVVYLTLGALLARTVARRKEKVYVILAAMLLTLLIGVSRVFLGVHYPTDVLAGWSAGMAWALLCWLVARHLQRCGQMATATHAAPADGDERDDRPDERA